MEETIIIPSSDNMVGYVWMSNKNYPGNDDKEPQIVNGRFGGFTLTNGENPFCIEAVLLDIATKKSYTVRYIDGRYIKTEFVVTDEELNIKNGNPDLREYLLNRFDNKLKLHFVQRWSAEKDDLCLNMETLKPKELVFVGFNDKEENK